MKTITILALGLISYSFAAEKHSLPGHVDEVLEKFCFDCHDEDVQKGNIRLDNLSDMDQQDRWELLNKIEEQVYLKQMPPKKKKQPAEAQHQEVLKWITAEFSAMKLKSQFRDKLREPAYGNYVDHNKLFSGEIKDKSYSPARRWIVSPYIFQNRIQEIFKTQVKNRIPVEIVNPFHLPDVSGVRYYDNDLVGSGHFITMMSNAKIISYAQLGMLSKEDEKANKEKAQKYVLELEKLNKSDLKEAGSGGSKALLRKKLKSQYAQKRLVKINYRDKSKASTPFEVILNKKSSPTEEEIEAAINFQFAIVHKRPANTLEINDCKELTNKAIAKVGNAEGLRRMLVAVMLQPDLLYRSEFGEGKADDAGRKKLSSREAAYSLAYALTERDPDEKLLEAVKSDNLKTKEEYKKQILRLLAYQVPHKIDPRLKTRSFRSYTTTQLVKLRFFREFFGYLKGYQVFKDNKRFEGGRHDHAIVLLINDADLMVETILKKDKDVFNELLTTEKFYLYHNGDNKSTLKALEVKKKAVKQLLSQDWQKDPEAFHKKNRKALSTAIGI